MVVFSLFYHNYPPKYPVLFLTIKVMVSHIWYVAVTRVSVLSVLSLRPQAALLLCVVSVLDNNAISQRFESSLLQIQRVSNLELLLPQPLRLPPRLTPIASSSLI
jgi:hypothetical protein